jgi:hypothetical protein
MSLDATTKAYLDVRHNELLERFSEQGRQLARSTERCETLIAEVCELRQQLAAAKVELAEVKAASIQDWTAAQDRMDDQDDTIRALSKDILAQKKLIKDQSLDIDDLQQYGRRQSIRVQGVAVVPGENDNDTLLFDQINKTLAPSNIVLRETDVIHFHRSSAIKDDKYAPGTKSSQVILKLKHWNVRARFQGLNTLMRKKEEKGGDGCRVYHDLTKRRLDLLNSARESVKGVPGWFAYADINSGLKLRCDKLYYKFNTYAELDAAIKEIKAKPQSK